MILIGLNEMFVLVIAANRQAHTFIIVYTIIDYLDFIANILFRNS